jgi:RteC protein
MVTLKAMTYYIKTKSNMPRQKKGASFSMRRNTILEAEQAAIQKETVDFLFKQAERSFRATKNAMQAFRRKRKLPSDQAAPTTESDLDLTVSFIAGKRYLHDLYRAISVLSTAHDTPRMTSLPLLWTGSESALVELAYALYKSGAFNNGQAELKNIVKLLENAFRVPMENAPRTFQEIRNRKSGPTIFIDKLHFALVAYIDELEVKEMEKIRKQRTSAIR